MPESYSFTINGKRADADLTPGRFASITRTWKNGDRVALEFDIPLTLQPVDPQHPNVVALKHGSLSNRWGSRWSISPTAPTDSRRHW